MKNKSDTNLLRHYCNLHSGSFLDVGRVHDEHFKDLSESVFRKYVSRLTNDEQNLADTAVKNEALRDYIYGINQNRGYDPKVVGGIVCQSGTQFYLFEGRDYHDYMSNHDGWVNFNEFLRKIEVAYDIEKALKKLK